MKWELSGADRMTGENRRVVLEADSEDSARRRANRQGLMVADARALDPGDSVHGRPGTHPAAAPAPRGALEEHEVFTTTLHPLAVFLIPGLLCLVVVGLFVLPFAYLRYRFTRFVVTSKRITIRRGWLNRNSFEMLLTKIESIHIEQKLIDRILGSGTVVICGTGGSREVFPGIKAAEKFRASANESIERSSVR